MYESPDGYSKEDNTLKIVNLKQSEISLLKIVYQDLSRFIDEESKSCIYQSQSNLLIVLLSENWHKTSITLTVKLYLKILIALLYLIRAS